ncbi:hypothetical protein EYR36_009953 [Pleurotus pulmonarius]|nr:hypothetical protein EYR36_009953 [Pleurotus pulmonarius]KAF4593430.1 hypothetical protein EYR38_009144 [Pleurotus pulmonarius]
MARSQGKSQRQRRTSATHPPIPIPQNSAGVPEEDPKRHPVRKASQTSDPAKDSDAGQEGAYDENPERFIASALHRFGEPAMRSSPWVLHPSRDEDGDADNYAEDAMDTQGRGRASLVALPSREDSKVETRRTPPAPPWNRPPVFRAAVDENFHKSSIAPAGPVCRFGYPLQSKALSPTSTAIGGVPHTTKPAQGTAPRYLPVYNWAESDKAFMAAPDEDWESEVECDSGEHVVTPEQRHWMGGEASETQPLGITIAMSPRGNPYPQTYGLQHRAPPQYSYLPANTSCHSATTRLSYGDSTTNSPTSYRREETAYASTEAAMSYPRATRGDSSYGTHTNEAVSAAGGSEAETYGAVDGGYRWQAGDWAEK